MCVCAHTHTRARNACVRARVARFGIFEDAATYKGKGPSNPDSLEACYVNILGQRVRHVVYAVPKSRMCGERCGCPCRGRCTKVAIEKILLWFCEVAAAGVHPTRRHDGLPFTEQHRRDSAGKPLVPQSTSPSGTRFVVLEYRADWLQISTGLGFPTATQNHFCWKCDARKRDAYKFEQSWCWPSRSHDTYTQQACEVTVSVTMDRASLCLRECRMRVVLVLLFCVRDLSYQRFG